MLKSPLFPSPVLLSPSQSLEPSANKDLMHVLPVHVLICHKSIFLSLSLPCDFKTCMCAYIL